MGNRLVSKKEMAKLLGFSERTVSGLLSRGMPHMRFGARRVRIDPEDAIRWCKEYYGSRRIGGVVDSPRLTEI